MFYELSIETVFVPRQREKYRLVLIGNMGSRVQMHHDRCAAVESPRPTKDLLCWRAERKPLQKAKKRGSRSIGRIGGEEWQLKNAT